MIQKMAFGFCILMIGITYVSADASSARKYLNDAMADIIETMEDYSIDTCMDESKTTTKFNECQSILSSFQSRLDTYKLALDGYVNDGTLSNSDALIEDFNYLYQDAQKFLSEMQDEIEEEKDAIDDDSQGGSSSDFKSDSSSELDLAGLCDEARVARTLKFLGIIIYLIKIFVPVLIIVMGSIDFGKAMFSGKTDDVSKLFGVLQKRFITGVVVFFIPSIISLLFDVIDTYSETINQYENCWTCILEPGDCEVNQ